MLNIYLNNGKVINVGKLVIMAVCVLLVILSSIFLVRYLTTGELVVTTNDKANSIVVTRAFNYNQNVYGKSPSSKQIASGEVLHLSSGTYSVVVSNQSFSSQQVVQIKSRHSSHIVINLDKTSELDPVLSRATDNVVASANKLLYIDPTTNFLYQDTSQDSDQVLDSSHRLTSISWANTSFGVGQDSTGNFYTIEGGIVSSLNLSFAYTPNPLTQYAVAPNQEIYIATSSALYRGTANGLFQKIYNIQYPVSSVSASNQAVSFYEGKDNDDQNTEKSEISAFYVIDQAGKVYHVSNGEVTQESWSKSGEYLAAIVNGQLVIWNSTLGQLAFLPNDGITSLAWLDDNTLFYGLSNGAWSYSMQTNRATLLAQSTAGQAVTELSPSTDGAYLYISLETQQQPTTTYELARIGLHNQPTPNLSLMEELTAFLPNSVDGCSLNYLNLVTEPTIIIQTTPSLQQSCLQEAQIYLNEYGVDTSQLSFSLTGGDS